LNTLIIDTSTSLSILVLTVNNETFSIIEDAGTRHSITMFDSISALLSKSGASISDVELIGTGIGPGSFTGVRVAVSTSRMFAQLLKLPLVGIHSHDLFASAPWDKNITHKLIAFDAKKNKVFGALYSRDGEYCRKITGPGDYTIPELTENIEKGMHIQLIGDGCGKYLNELKEDIENQGSSSVFTENFIPCDKSMSELVLNRYSDNPGEYMDYNSTIPDYARKSDAETALKKKKNED
jgi:tRNA threonylcarbamoyladenosine biosynthesis protein TsaB